MESSELLKVVFNWCPSTFFVPTNVCRPGKYGPNDLEYELLLLSDELTSLVLLSLVLVLEVTVPKDLPSILISIPFWSVLTVI